MVAESVRLAQDRYENSETTAVWCLEEVMTRFKIEVGLHQKFHTSKYP